MADFVGFAFGYDISADTYKVVAVFVNNVNVFNLGDNVWRNIQSSPVVHFKPRCHPFSNDGVYLRGTINWLAIPNKTENDSTIEKFVILSLDLGTETYRQLLPPQGFAERPAVKAPVTVEPGVTVLMECLCFYHCFDFRGNPFCFMEDDGTWSSGILDSISQI
jgi:F-box interacting protein